MDIKVCVSHRLDIDSYVVSSDIITPVLCGAVYADGVVNMQGDNIGDNISEKRLCLGEFTVEYWMWKNLKADYYGLCHYRRYFSLSGKSGYRNGDNHLYEFFLNNKTVQKHQINNDDKIISLCNAYDIIIPEPADVTKVPAYDDNIKTVRDLWVYHQGTHLANGIIDTFLSSLKEMQFPLYDEAIEYFSTRYHIGYNCFIVKKEIFNEMCELIFNTYSRLVKEYEHMVELKKYPRTLGYLCEIMFGIYIYKTKKDRKYKEVPLIFFGETSNNISFYIKLKLYFYEYGKRFLKKYFSTSLYNKVKSVYKKIKK